MIEVKDLGFTYSKKQQNIFKGLSFNMEAGHIYGLLGKNGAGKTTLLKLIAGIRFPKEGSCTVLNMDSKCRNAEMLQNIYFLTEEVWLPDTSISEYLKMYAVYYPGFDHLIFDKCLREFEINTSQNLKHMSYGQRKKVAISFAFATRCRILIMDEPTNGLDIPSKTQFRKLAAELITDDCCLILSTHQVRDLESLIDQIIILENSKILLNDTTDIICEKLVFKTLISLENQPELLYSEFTPKGYQTVFRNTEHIDSKLDLEVLFNFATQQPTVFTSIFNH